ncbi:MULTISPECIES: hypothetical protein [Megasphaera]|jgi:hypothetical protein|uniref:Uncharacterized protein n=1 Tax=Megasphaera hutchinsoni TaxID=1588748 RepID=A0A134CFJ4_9FIRM|nr:MULTISPECIES: hypothetical protein [Megasphaera]EGS36666.1 hypothetical protein HMPREF1040_0759 [Megasphaera sp. UPII 135-E]KXB90874.1 hypothetical protein HMPREF3182_00955 [Megasphaera hutchinsoni]MUP59309.1 hypothetical protein [Veillonellaceae bacterium M2-4]PNH22586.1 hypothetical protein CAL30_01100 [Megasphaera genomosp. type_2]
MKKLVRVLWAVVIFYLVYSLYVEGIRSFTVLLLVLAMLLFGMEEWKGRSSYRKLRKKEIVSSTEKLKK